MTEAVRAAWHRSGRQPDAARTQYDAHLYALHLGAAEAVTPAMLLDAALAPLRCARPSLRALSAGLGGTLSTSILSPARSSAAQGREPTLPASAIVDCQVLPISV